MGACCQRNKNTGSIEMSGENELIVACSWCKEIMAGDATSAEVAEAMESGANEVRGRMISHGICEPCKTEVLAEYETEDGPVVLIMAESEGKSMPYRFPSWYRGIFPASSPYAINGKMRILPVPPGFRDTYSVKVSV